MIFENRNDAGKKLAEKLSKYKGTDAIVLAIPRGGVVIGYEVSKALQLSLDIVVPRKIGAPFQPELAIGAIAGKDIGIFDKQTIEYLGISDDYIEQEVRKQREEITRRERSYRGDRPFPSLENRTVLLVDDGIATGYTTIAASRAVKQMNPEKLVLAVPVAPPEAVERLKSEVDEIVVLEMPEPFFAVGSWYYEFNQTSDNEVKDLLQKSLQE
ncbi:MAG: phosphoribosyltransferase [Armatimonadota bacterium]